MKRKNSAPLPTSRVKISTGAINAVMRDDDPDCQRLSQPSQISQGPSTFTAFTQSIHSQFSSTQPPTSTNQNCDVCKQTSSMDMFQVTSLQCYFCSKSFHGVCLKLANKSLLDFLYVVAEIGGWACQSCRLSLAITNKPTPKNKTINSNIDSLHQEIISIKTQLDLISDSVLSLHKANQADTESRKIDPSGSTTYARIVSGAASSNQKEIGQANVDPITNENKLDNNLRSQILLAVHSEQQLKNKRSSSLVLTGLPFKSAEDDMRSFINLCEQEFSISPSVRATSRLGKQEDGKILPLLVTLDSKLDADQILQNAKLLRASSSLFVRNKLYINRYMTRTEFLAAYKARRERQTKKSSTTTINSGNGSIDTGLSAEPVIFGVTAMQDSASCLPSTSKSLPPVLYSSSPGAHAKVIDQQTSFIPSKSTSLPADLQKQTPGSTAPGVTSSSASPAGTKPPASNSAGAKPSAPISAGTKLPASK